MEDEEQAAIYVRVIMSPPKRVLTVAKRQPSDKQLAPFIYFDRTMTRQS